MERRFVLFLVLAFAILLGYSALMQKFLPPRPPRPQEGRAAAARSEKEEGGQKADKAAPAAGQQEQLRQQPDKFAAERAEPAAPAGEVGKPEPAPVVKAAPEPEVAQQWITLGSADQKDPYRMLVTLTNQGAAVARIELNSPRYCDIDDRSGYLGHIITGSDVHKDGCPVHVVGPGTPAAEAGLRAGDLLKSVNGKPVIDARSLQAILEKTKPNQKVKLSFARDDQEQAVEVKLRRRPLEIIKPELNDPLSLLLTLRQFDEQEIKPEEPAKADEENSELGRELAGVALRQSNWQVVAADQDACTFRRRLPEKDLEILKTYRLVKVPEAKPKEPIDADYPAYHLEFEIEIRNIGGQAHKVAYRLDGPNGLPTEGAWYALKVGRSWGLAGLRDFIISFGGGTPHMVGPAVIADEKTAPKPWPEEPDQLLTFIGIDAQYFSTILMPQRAGLRRGDLLKAVDGKPVTDAKSLQAILDETKPNQKVKVSFVRDGQEMTADVELRRRPLEIVKPEQNDPLSLLLALQQFDVWFEELQPLRIGKFDAKHPNLLNTSCRLASTADELKPGDALKHTFKLFVGPKMPGLLAHYGLGSLVYYGWFEWAAVPLVGILHVFYGVFRNYGIAIILLTVVVRGCMFPFSRKQALGAQKMQELQPEIKKIQEKYKKDIEGRTKAQNELFRKHNYHPLGGCLTAFIQIPVFMALYNLLRVDVELRDAPLLSHAIRWCSNLAAPDMLFYWKDFVPNFVVNGAGLFPSLGEYFNLLPILSLVLFTWQQKMFMPPPADEQAATQQKIMQFMPILIGLMFFKVPSGICLYIIISTLWGLGERKFLPKPKPPESANVIESRAEAKARARAAALAAQARTKKK